MNTSDLEWRTSRRSGGHSACVQVAAAGQAAGGLGAGHLLLVRDSKDTAGPVLAITPAGWATFSRQIKEGRLRSGL
jgi:Domain of unknown function (DUF397)